MSRAPVERPRPRSDALIVRDLADEVVVFDERSNRAHCLNPTAARVWRRCDGRSTPSEIARELGLDERVVLFALEGLHKAKLLDRSVEPSPIFAGMTRRQAMRVLMVAAAGVAVPLVLSVLAPSSAEAASCLQQDQHGCKTGGFCCVGLTCSGGGHCRKKK